MGLTLTWMKPRFFRAALKSLDAWLKSVNTENPKTRFANSTCQQNKELTLQVPVLLLVLVEKYQFCGCDWQNSLFYSSHGLIPDGAPCLEYLSEKQKCYNELFVGREYKHMQESDVYTPAVCGHTFIAAVFFVPVFAVYGWVVASRPHAHACHSCTGGPVHLHLILKHRAILQEAGTLCTFMYDHILLTGKQVKI